MINDILQKDTIKADLGFGVDYYKGEPGEQGIPGKDGKSAYQIALDEGFEGTEAEWLASLKGKDGKDGINGTDGKPGKDGTNGKDGKTPVKGVDYFTQAEIQQIEDNAAAKIDLSDYAKTADLSTVATSGSYNDLVNKPTIPSVEGLASETYVDTKVAAIVIPEVPTKVSELENDKGYLTEHQSLEGYAKTADLAQVAKTGSYNDLADKPTIPSTTGLASTKYVDDKVAGIVIPTVPTKVSAFENDAGYLTEHQSLAEYAKKTEIPTVPTNVSAFTNDAGYLTEHQSLADYSTTAQVQTMISSAIGAITNGNEVSY